MPIIIAAAIGFAAAKLTGDSTLVKGAIIVAVGVYAFNSLKSQGA